MWREHFHMQGQVRLDSFSETYDDLYIYLRHHHEDPA